MSLIAANFLIIRSLPDSFFEEFGGLHGDSFLAPLVTWGFFLLVCLGVSLGIAQGLVLSVVYRRNHFLLWISTCLLGVPAGGLVFLISSIILANGAPSLFSVSIALLLAGATIGVVQSAVLRHIIHEVGWWILINGIALNTAMVIGLLMEASMTSLEIKRLPFYPLEAAFHWGVSWGAGTVVFAGLTGFVLIILPQKPYEATDNNNQLSELL